MMSSLAFFFPQSVIEASFYSIISEHFSLIFVVQFGEFVVFAFVFSLWLFRKQDKGEDAYSISLHEPLPESHTPLPIFQCADDTLEPDFSIQEPLLPTPTPLPVPLPYFTSNKQVASTSDGTGIPVVIVSTGTGVPSDDQAVSVVVSGESSDGQGPLESTVTVADHGVGDNQGTADQAVVVDNPVDDNPVIVDNPVVDNPVDNHTTTDNHPATDNHTTTDNNPTTPMNDTTTPPSDNKQTLCCLCKKNPAVMRILPCEEEICSNCLPTGGRCPSCGAPVLTIESIRNYPVCLKHSLIPYMGFAPPLCSPIHYSCRKHDYFVVNSHHVP